MTRELSWDEIDLNWNDIQDTWDNGINITIGGGSPQYSPDDKDFNKSNKTDIKQVKPISTLLIKKIGLYTKIKNDYYTKTSNKLNIKAKADNLSKIRKSIKINIHK
jgi:hypothetical protein